MKIPEGAQQWNKALLGAFKKGVRSHQSGDPLTSCPYIDRRKPDGRLSWSRSFISAWRDGWMWSRDGNAGNPQETTK